MRPIKFRAWHKTKHYMGVVTLIRPGEIVNLELEGVARVEGQIHEGYHNSGAPNYAVDIGDVVLMQYTGLKDKNRVEIFDGDLCRYKNEYTDIVRQVKWLPKSAGWNIDDRYLSDTEVIGNIYSSPELLGAK
jgi:uncharacterized phage protein (TIGR01671 family)